MTCTLYWRTRTEQTGVRDALAQTVAVLLLR
jgi:hypothetical protein